MPANDLSPRNLTTVATAAFAAAALALTGLGYFTWTGYERYLTTAKWVQRTDEVVLEIREVRKIINEAQSGERGFVISNDTKFLKGYDLALANADIHISRLENLMADSTDQTQRMQQLKPKFHNTLREIAKIVELRKKGKAREATQRVLDGYVRSDSDEVRDILDTMEREEGRLMKVRTEQAELSATQHRRTLALAYAVSAIILVVTGLIALRSLKGRQKAESDLNRFFDSSLDLFCVAGFDGYFKKINPMFTETLGYSLGQLRTIPFIDFVHPDDRGVTLKEMEKLAGGAKTLQFENRYLRKDGTYVWLSWKSIPFFDEGMIYAVARDVTAQRQLERDNTEARHAAQSANEAKSQFLANMSHEIRTPMNGVIGMTKLLLDTKLNTEQVELADHIQTSANGLLQIINDILDFSKIEAGKLGMEIVDFELGSLLMDVQKSMSYAAGQKGLALTLRNPGLPHYLRGDSSRIRQVLLNLVSNALKFTRHGSVSVSVEPVIDQQFMLHLKFLVKDTGIGISNEALTRMFKVFSQADSSVSRKYGGTGLGLSICKSLVELMGGTIGVDTVLGQGSTFWFALPFHKGQALAGSNFEFCELHPGQRKFSGRLLVVEDNTINQKVIAKTLEKLGCKVHIAANGLEALAALKEIEFDIVLMDCQMPELDGYEATRIIRQHPDAKIRNIPVVAMTANAIEGDKEKCLAAGMTDYLSKPLNDSRLYEVLAKYLKPSVSGSTLAAGVKVDSLQKLEDLQIDGEPDIVTDIVNTFLSETGAKIKAIADAVNQQQFEEARQIAHGLKSSAQTLGAHVMGDLCQELEDMSDADFPRRGTAASERLVKEYEQVEKQLHDFLIARSAVKTQKSA